MSSVSQEKKHAEFEMQLGKPKAFAHTVGVLYATEALAGVCVCSGEGGEGDL